MRSEKAWSSVSSVSFWKVCSCLLLMVAWCNSARPQVNRATITGTVTDRSGAVIAGVEVTARNVGTNVETTGVSNADGIYLVLNLPPGTYALTFQKDGFKKIEQPSITLESTQEAGINVVMQVGEATEKVVVTTDAPVLDHESATVGTNLNGKIVTDLPVDIYGGGRFVENFAVALTPGYSPLSDPFNSVVNGGQYYTKDYTVDGTSAVSSIRGNSIETGPSMEAVGELQAQTSGLDAQSAITTGGVIAFTLKSGTDQFHGSTFGYGRNEALDANTWTNDALGLPRARRRAWDYGASLGGPIRKGKTFFFGTFERYTQTDFTPGGYTSFVPTAAMLGGDFSALLNKTMVVGTDTHGNTVYQGAIFNPGDPGAVFVGNKIPTTMFSSTSNKIVALFQKSYVPERAGLNNNDRTPQSGFPHQTPNQAVVKLDHNIGSRDRLSGSWIYNHRPTVQVDQGGVWAPGSTDGGPLTTSLLKFVRSQEYRASESHVFSSNLLNVLNLTYNWYWNGQVPTATGTDWNSQLGFGSTGADNFPNISFGNPVNGLGVTGIGSSAQKSFTGATTLVDDAVTWTKGRHNFSFGGDFRAYQVNSHTSTGVLNYNFDPAYTAGPSAAETNVTGFGFASFLLGHAQNASETTGVALYGRRKSTSFFGQDSYKVTPKLTLNLGLRWNYSGRYHEKYGHWANFDLNAIETNPAFAWVGLPGTIVYAKGGGDSFEKKEYWTNFGPQIGFAYSPRNRWVVRGSFGLIYLPPIGPYYNGVPNGWSPGFTGTNTVNPTGGFQWDGKYPGTFVPGSTNVNPQTQYYLTTVDPHALMAGLSQAFNIGAQYELTKDLRLEVAYVGNRGHHLPDTALAFNQASAKEFLNVVNANPGLVWIGDFSSWQSCSTKGAPLSNQYTGVPYVGITCPYPGFSGPALAAIAPYPQVADWSGAYWFGSAAEPSYVGLPLGQSFYNSMVVDLVKRTGRGLTMDFNYTLSRTEGDTFSSQQEYNGFYTPVQDFSNISQAAHTVTGYDQTNVVKGFVVYELPFGKGRRWLSNSGRTVNALAGGWTLTGLVQYRSGQPFQMGISQPYYPLYSTFYPNFHLSGFTGPNDPHKFQAGPCGQSPLPPCVFYLPQSIATSPIPADTSKGTVALGSGPAAIPDLRCPGHANEDISLLKYFTMGADGRYQLSLRGEFYNLFNRHEYAINGCSGTGPQNKVGASNFGQVTGIIENPRAGQFAVRFTF
jgi:hypothetical protein